jgi:hypothetical protein
MRVTGIVLLVVYMVYLALISISLTRIMNMMKKAYRHLICVTLAVIVASLVILVLNGQVASHFERPILYVAQYALFNFYMILVAYLYSPCIVTRIPISASDSAARERDAVMS